MSCCYYIVIEIVLYGNSIYQESRIYTGGKSDALLEIIFGRQIRDTQLHVYRSNCSLITHTTAYVRWCWQFYIIDQEAAGFHPEPITLMKKSIDTAHVQKKFERQIRDSQLHVFRSNCSLITHTTAYVRWCWQFNIIHQGAAGFHPEPITLMKKSIDTAHVIWMVA